MLRLFRRTYENKGPGQQALTVTHEGVQYAVLARRIPNARRFTLRVRSATRDVIITMPKRAAFSAAQEFAQRHAAWIAARMGRLPRSIPFKMGEIIPIRGEDHVIFHKEEVRGWIQVERKPEDALPKLHVACNVQHLPRRVHDYLKREAKRDLETAVRRYTAQLGFASRKVTVRDTTSRWGSCSASGCLSFSWRLILAPPEVLDYLAAHEVAHLVHMNHSPEFWSLTRQLAPHTDKAEVWLTRHGASLYRYGAEN